MFTITSHFSMVEFLHTYNYKTIIYLTSKNISFVKEGKGGENKGDKGFKGGVGRTIVKDSVTKLIRRPD